MTDQAEAARADPGRGELAGFGERAAGPVLRGADLHLGHPIPGQHLSDEVESVGSLRDLDVDGEVGGGEAQDPGEAGAG
ncbi:hypothetical protein [Rhizohabitans arisaemae]|uniref:hypothetical protein n=1 Tax=Rhizohabitans arisaemae TaxID=2720610 RepID=UPI0024B1270F|nr:hypothetical protein [Rhizohabitans arisaemae]